MKWNPNFLVLLCWLIAISTAPVCGAIIPPGRLPGGVLWASNQVGVVGGIPNVTVVYSNLYPTNTLADINKALLKCPSNEVVYLNAGTYIINGTIDWGDAGNNGGVLRGAGFGQTILVFTNASICIQIRSPYRYGDPPENPNLTANWLSGYTQGSTNITVDKSFSGPGTLICLDQGNDTNVVNPSGSETTETDQIRTNQWGQLCNQQQYVMITGVSNGTNLTISPGVYMTNYQPSLHPQIWWAGPPVTMCGIENMTLNCHFCGSGAYGIFLQSAYNCWVKNVEVTNSWYAAVQTFECAHIAVQDCYIHDCGSGGASTTYGINPHLCSDCLFVDNIFATISSPFLLDCGASGCVIAYNYCTNMIYPGNWMAAAFTTHGAHPDMNLFEGNVGTAIIFDCIHGSSSHNTVFRNYLYGLEPSKGNNTYPVDADATNRWMSFLGNVIGTPGYHTNYQYDVGCYPTNFENVRTIYRLGFFGNNATNGDLQTAATLLRDGNWDAASGTTVWDSNGVQSLPASLFLTTKPTWWTNWGNALWPSIGPDVTPLTNAIPAQLRFLTLRNAGQPNPLQPPTNLRIVNP